jgi:hypothetical protein
MNKRPNIFQLIWGAALTAAGFGVLALLPQRMEQIRQLRQAQPYDFDILFLWFCFGLLGVLLIGGGLRKIYGNFRDPSGSDPDGQDRDES